MEPCSHWLDTVVLPRRSIARMSELLHQAQQVLSRLDWAICRALICDVLAARAGTQLAHGHQGVGKATARARVRRLQMEVMRCAYSVR